jgi:hypothetical protein
MNMMKIKVIHNKYLQISGMAKVCVEWQKSFSSLILPLPKGTWDLPWSTHCLLPLVYNHMVTMVCIKVIQSSSKYQETDLCIFRGLFCYFCDVFRHHRVAHAVPFWHVTFNPAAGSALGDWLAEM